MTRSEHPPAAPPAPDLGKLRELLNESSFGTQGSRALQQRAPAEEVAAIKDLAARKRQAEEFVDCVLPTPEPVDDPGEESPDLVRDHPGLPVVIVAVKASRRTPSESNPRTPATRAQYSITDPVPSRVAVTRRDETKTPNPMHVCSWGEILSQCVALQPRDESTHRRYDLAFDRYTETSSTLRSAVLRDLLAVMFYSGLDRAGSGQIVFEHKTFREFFDNPELPLTARCHECSAPIPSRATRTTGRPAKYCSSACRQRAYRNRVAGTPSQSWEAVWLTDSMCSRIPFLASAYEAIAGLDQAPSLDRRTATHTRTVIDELREAAEQFADELDHTRRTDRRRMLIVLDNTEDDAHLVRVDSRVIERCTERISPQESNPLLIWDDPVLDTSIDPQRQPTDPMTDRAVRMFQEGASFSTIARTFKNEGVPPPDGAMCWLPRHVRLLLRTARLSPPENGGTTTAQSLQALAAALIAR